jgi:hypothetical protein
VLEYAAPFTSVSHTPPASALRIVAALGVFVGGVEVAAELEEPPLQPAVTIAMRHSNANASGV